MVQCDALLLLMGIPPHSTLTTFLHGGITGTPGGMFSFVDKELDAFKEFLGGQWAGKSQRANFECESGWWFQTCVYFHNIWDNPSH